MKLMGSLHSQVSRRYVPPTAPDTLDGLIDVVFKVQGVLIQRARVAKSADAKDLKSFFAQAECGFNSHPGHHKLLNCPVFVQEPEVQYSR